MTYVKFIREDSGNFRNYYRGVNDHKLYCTQPASMITLPEFKRIGLVDWLECSNDGEPSYCINDTFEVVNG